MPEKSHYKRYGRSLPRRQYRINFDPFSTEEIVVGSIAIHQDESKNHIALVLDMDDQYTLALFFSSVAYGIRSREATTDELALAGFAYTKQTFLCLVHRLTNEFYHHQGLTFPDYRVQDLRREFGIDKPSGTQTLPSLCG